VREEACRAAEYRREAFPLSSAAALLTKAALPRGAPRSTLDTQYHHGPQHWMRGTPAVKRNGNWKELAGVGESLASPVHSGHREGACWEHSFGFISSPTSPSLVPKLVMGRNVPVGSSFSS